MHVHTCAFTVAEYWNGVGQILAKFSHNNIVSYYGSFVEDNNVNVVMEYADGGTLFNRISSAKKPFPEDVLMNIFTQV
jgi:NIMA (never in mitosis gene a)-related kinase